MPPGRAYEAGVTTTTLPFLHLLSMDFLLSQNLTILMHREDNHNNQASLTDTAKEDNEVGCRKAVFPMATWCIVISCDCHQRKV